MERNSPIASKSIGLWKSRRSTMTAFRAKVLLWATIVAMALVGLVAIYYGVNATSTTARVAILAAALFVLWLIGKIADWVKNTYFRGVKFNTKIKSAP